MRRVDPNNLAIVYLSPIKTSWELSSDMDGKRIFRKELIYPGHFVKMKPGTNTPEIEFDVSEELIDHWVMTFGDMDANGIDVPIAKQHSTDPEDRRGTVVKLSKEFNPRRGMNSLYMYAVFRDAEAEKLANTTQVSLFAPPEYTDGKRNTYERPIRHVALTDYPVIPGLDGFTPIAASFDTGEEDANDEEDTMNLAQVSAKLGIKHDQGANPIDLANGIIRMSNRQSKKIASLMEELDALKKNGNGEDEEDEDAELADDEERKDEDMEDEDAELGDDEDEDEDKDEDAELGDDEDEEGDMDDEDAELGDDEDEDEDEDIEFSFDRVKPRRQSKKSQSINAKLVASTRKIRRLELSELVRRGNITPAVAKRLAKRFCSTKAITLSLSSNSRDVFDDLLSDLAGNRPLTLGERTRKQLRKGESNPVLADAERRAKESKN